MGRQPALFFAFLGVLALLSFSLFAKQTASQEDFFAKVLLHARWVYSSKESHFISSKKNPLPMLEGSRFALQDGDLESAALFDYPADHPDRTHALLEIGLSHFPIMNQENKIEPKRRVPLKLIFHNGICGTCDQKSFRSVSRAKKIRVQFLARQANNPDNDYGFPPVQILQEITVDLPDHGEAVLIPLNPYRFADSSSYPKDIYFLMTKIEVLEIYAGSDYPNSVAMRELSYTDADAEHGKEHNWSYRLWKK